MAEVRCLLNLLFYRELFKPLTYIYTRNNIKGIVYENKTTNKESEFRRQLRYKLRNYNIGATVSVSSCRNLCNPPHRYYLGNRLDWKHNSIYIHAYIKYIHTVHTNMHA